MAVSRCLDSRRCPLALTLALLFGLSAFAGPTYAAEPLRGPLVVSERWPECTSLATWTRDVMRLEGLGGASETAQAKAFFRWLRLFSRMATGGMIQAYEGEYGREQYVLDAHKNLFVYGWGFCDTSSRIAEAAWSEFKQDRGAAERVCVMHDNGGFHTMYRLRLDGRYGAFDPRYGYYLVERDSPDARVLDWNEVGVDQNILRNRGYRYRSQPFFEYLGLEWERALLIQPAYYPTEEEWRKAGGTPECVFGNGMYEMGTRFHDMDFDLAKGMSIERFWNGNARSFYVPANPAASREEPFLLSGRFYRVTETMLDGNWPKFDPNYRWAEPYLARVPTDERYNRDVAGGRTLGQASGSLVYEPDLRETPELLLPDTTLVPSRGAVLLAPRSQGGAGQAAFDIRCPYVLVGGTLAGELAGDSADALKVELRVLQAKPRNESEPERWSAWDVVRQGPGQFTIPVGRERFNGKDASIYGTYRFQVRVTVGSNPDRRKPAGLSRLRISTAFENGIMSIPQIFAGRNVIHFKVRDASPIDGEVRVTYRYQTAAGEKENTRILRAADFSNGMANYTVDAPGLVRCNSLAIAR